MKTLTKITEGRTGQLAKSYVVLGLKEPTFSIIMVLKWY